MIIWGILLLSSYEVFADKEGMFVEKPRDLLPEDTLVEDYRVKVRIEPVDTSLQSMALIILNESYNLPIILQFSKQPNGLMGNVSGLQQTQWSKNAIHEIAESISFAGYTFAPEKESVLTFKVIPDKGYVYVSGNGEVTTPDKGKIILGRKSFFCIKWNLFCRKEIVIGHPSKLRANGNSDSQLPFEFLK